MVRAKSFMKFHPGYKGRISDVLSNVVNDAQRSNSKLRVKWLVAVYFSMATLNEIEEKGIKFTFVQFPEASHVIINGKSMVVEDIQEANLYRILFDQFMTDSYTFQVKKKNLTKVIANFKKFFIPHIRLDTTFGVYALRQLRAYALLQDYGVPKEAVKKLFGYKTWVFEDIEMDRAIELVAKANKGIKLTPSVV